MLSLIWFPIQAQQDITERSSAQNLPIYLWQVTWLLTEGYTLVDWLVDTHVTTVADVTAEHGAFVATLADVSAAAESQSLKCVRNQFEPGQVRCTQISIFAMVAEAVGP